MLWLPPIYEVLCDITGFNGKTGTVETEQLYEVNEERVVSVSFFAATSPGFPVQFAPKGRLDGGCTWKVLYDELYSEKYD